MKKTLIQMLITSMMLFIIFCANEAVISKAVPVSANIDETVSLPIIMYHSILRDSAQAGDYVISPDTLKNDLEYLKKNGYETVTVKDLVRYVDGISELPKKPVMITFDDGYFNNFYYAYPILKEYDMKAVISIIGNETELYSSTGQENAYWSYLNTDRLLEMSDVFEVQNHSYNLHETAPRKGSTRMRGESVEDYRQVFINDTEKVQQLLSNAGIPAPICYTYPYGFYTSESEELLKSLGFLCTMTCEERINEITREEESLYALGRFNRPNGISSEEFFGKILG